MRIFQVLNGSGRTGEVVLSGPLNPEALPEWWGAGSIEDPLHRDDQAALAEASRAAFNRRDSDVIEPPLALVLRTGYRLTRAWVIDTPAGFEGTGIILRGALKSIDATFRAADTSGFGDAILEIRGRTGCVIENVSFDARGQVERCVLLEVVARQDLPLADVFRDCEFRGATAANVEVRKAAPAPSESDVVSKGITVFERCVFCRPPESYALKPTACEWGVLLDTAPIGTARFEHCVFDGVAGAMVCCRGGHFAATACSFRNLSGTDILLNGRQDPMGTGRTLGASCLLVGCDSVSLHLVSTDTSVAERQTTLIGVSHRPAHEAPDRWSVTWNIGDRVPRPNDVTLTMAGCSITAPVVCGAIAGRILDLGNGADTRFDSGAAVGSFVHFPSRP